jgi:alkanesulfonate monooxygenase SsuD/methylene tetrahydromethanopterin reductase-like flavin-dependent oxidoreductase (luciferase family)
MSVEIGVILPTSTPDPARPILGDVGVSARRAEQLGLDSVWSTDHLIPSGPMVEASVTLAAAAAVTEHIKIGYNVLLLSLRPPAWAAKQIAGLQYVSGNRLRVGVGTGNPVHGAAAWRAVGVPFEERGRRTDEALALLPDLVAGNPTRLPGGDEIALLPGAPMPPVLIAGDGRRARLRAARFGSGWMSIALTPDAVRARAGELADLAAQFGRPAPRVTVVAPPLADDPADAARQLADYAAAGTERVILPVTGPDWERDYERAAALRQAAA